MFIERKVTKILFGENIMKAEIENMYNILKEHIDNFGLEHEFTKLTPNLFGVNPDDAFSLVPYGIFIFFTLDTFLLEKGFHFLKFIENIIGESNFHEFLKSFLAKFKY